MAALDYGEDAATRIASLAVAVAQRRPPYVRAEDRALGQRCRAAIAELSLEAYVGAATGATEVVRRAEWQLVADFALRCPLPPG